MFQIEEGLSRPNIWQLVGYIRPDNLIGKFSSDELVIQAQLSLTDLSYNLLYSLKVQGYQSLYK